MRKLNSILAPIGLILTLAGPPPTARAAAMLPVPGNPVRIDSGLLAGTLNCHRVKAYYGIPFATPPVRQNRWRSPQPVKP